METLLHLPLSVQAQTLLRRTSLCIRTTHLMCTVRPDAVVAPHMRRAGADVWCSAAEILSMLPGVARISSMEDGADADLAAMTAAGCMALFLCNGQSRLPMLCYYECGHCVRGLALCWRPDLCLPQGATRARALRQWGHVFDKIHEAIAWEPGVRNLPAAF